MHCMSKDSKIIAAIDIGTNSFHLLIAKIVDKKFEELYREREVLRLRENSNETIYTISKDKISKAISMLNRFKETASEYNAKIIAVATSAIREASNKEEVINSIFNESGIKIEVISGEEEAKLAYSATRYMNDERDILIFDLGGGSTEIIIVQQAEIKFLKSIKLGAVRLTQYFFPNNTIDRINIDKCRKAIQKLLEPVKTKINEYQVKKVFGIGGTITSISWMIEKNVYGGEHDFKILFNYQIKKNDFEIIREMVLSKPTEAERALIPGFDKKRADVIATGVLIVDELFNLFLCDEITLVGYSLKEGIVLREIEKETSS